MPRFTLTETVAAPVEDVWKLVFDPTRYPEWWVGPETGLPEAPPLPLLLGTDRGSGRITLSCQVSAMEFVWQLAEHGESTRITVRVDVPPAAAALLEPERTALTASLAGLAALAMTGG